MLTLDQALEIATRSVQRITQQPVFGPSAPLAACGISNDAKLNAFIAAVVHEVGQFGYTISESNLSSLDRNTTIDNVAHVIAAYSLPGDDPFEEPSEPPINSGGDDTFEEPPG